MRSLKKAKVELAGVPIAGSGPVAWRLQTGVQPYQTVFSVHKDVWDKQFASVLGQDLQLDITDGRGVRTSIRGVSILNKVPSDSPNRVSFLVSDRRWRWPYKVVIRDYNVPKKTGERTIHNPTVPLEVENRVVVDEYRYRPYSLKNGLRWTAKQAVIDVLEILTGSDERTFLYEIESFPIADDDESGQFSLQNIFLRDSGDIALGRLLSYIPGCEVYMDKDGKARVIDAADLKAAEDFYTKELPPTTWDGDFGAYIDRAKIRPNKVIVYYQREIELMLQYSDNYGGTQTSLNENAPFIENVIPTVDPNTPAREYDPHFGVYVSKPMPPGTYLEAKAWLEAMDLSRPAGSAPWEFKTIATQWVEGDLDGVLGGTEPRGQDISERANILMRIQALKQHFRQTFRINRRYMERLRDINAVRVALLDPVTGARAPAAVWGQACIIPTTKGKRVAARRDGAKATIYRNVDYLSAALSAETPIALTTPGPAEVIIIDKDIGVFRLEWIASPYGTVGSFIPCLLVNQQDQPAVPTRNLSLQDTKPTGPNMKIEGGANGIRLSSTLKYRVMLTAIPAAPNSQRQFHAIEVKAGDIDEVFRTEFRIQNGKGPDLEIYVPPGEATARFAWYKDAECEETIVQLLGLDNEDPNEAGIEGNELPGFLLINQDTELQPHAQAIAAEMLASFADNFQGRVSTIIPENKDNMKLTGNMSGVTIQVGSAPSAKVVANWEFPGQQRPISRLALLPETARQIILGILPFKGAK